MRYFLIALIFCAAALACNPMHYAADPPMPDLVGRWRWEASSFLTRGMSQPVITTPASTGISMEVEFFPDNQLDLYHNGELVQQQEYSFWRSPDNPNYNLETSLGSLRPNLERGPVSIQGDSLLVISGGYNDAGATQTWTRIK